MELRKAEMPDDQTRSGDGDAASLHEEKNIGKGILGRLKRLIGFGQDDQSLREQIEEVIEEHSSHSDGADENTISPFERTMLRNMLHFSEHDVDDIMVPRSDIIAIDKSASFAEFVALFAEHGHSRVPVYEGDLDTIIGMVHIKDIFAIMATGEAPPERITAILRQPLFVPESMGVLDLLEAMQRERTHLAIVLDEYSGTEGLVTIEDIFEEIVGDIEDEHDDEPVPQLIAEADGSWLVDARTDLDDIAKSVDARLAEVEEDIDTIGGLAFISAGRVPQVGEIIDHDSGWRLAILAADDRRVERIRLLPPTSPAVNDKH
jgi:CBS domain containing-hemolysin-like protein